VSLKNLPAFMVYFRADRIQEHPSFLDWRLRNTLIFLLSGHVNKTDNEPGFSDSLSFQCEITGQRKNKNTYSLEFLGTPRIPIKALTLKIS
jgi:hypothetical protein